MYLKLLHFLPLTNETLFSKVLFWRCRKIQDGACLADGIPKRPGL
jgi:hypothetical protein